MKNSRMCDCTTVATAWSASSSARHLQRQVPQLQKMALAARQRVGELEAAVAAVEARR